MENTFRPWKEIARELAGEMNHIRALELAKELDKALAEQVLNQPEPQVAIDARNKAAEQTKPKP